MSNTQPPIDRRAALAAIGGLSLAGAAAASAAVSGSTRSILAAEPVGWDESTGEYTLPDLPYAYDALEPHIDAQTMEIHHSKHHAGYVRGLNRALAKLEGIRTGTEDPALIKHWSRELAFHGGGHVNHTLFWLGMAPADSGGGGRPAGELARRIDQDFGSFAQFVAHFKAASGAVEGSGWGWLVFDPVARRLRVTQMEKQQDTSMTGTVPLLGVDVWEHAYYLRYQNRRSAYVDAFMNIVNWPEVARRFEAAWA
ncbi:MAG: superoxide dismutase [Planctomycetota bacterium]